MGLASKIKATQQAAQANPSAPSFNPDPQHQQCTPNYATDAVYPQRQPHGAEYQQQTSYQALNAAYPPHQVHGAEYAYNQPYGHEYGAAHADLRYGAQGASHGGPQGASHIGPEYGAQGPHMAGSHPQQTIQGLPPNLHVTDALARKLQTIIQVQRLEFFYDSRRFQAVLQKLSSVNFAEIAAQWKIGKELAYDLASLILYDIVFYCDDSGSMAFEENGERIEDLKFILSKVSGIATLFDDDGISVRFMNSNVNGDGMRSAEDILRLISQVKFSGATPLGTNFERKVIQPLILGKAVGNQSLTKPVMAIIITDGEPYGESRDKILKVIREAKDALSRTPYGSGALAVQIAQVGKDIRTQKFLEELDKDPSVGAMIDCTSYYEMEEEEFARKGVTLTPELWLLKMCVGTVDPEYDKEDE
ncbi:hypothetical protein KP509_22G063000 [Ceratopteris richardii]|uniref:VWFA domain-containing protein n=1 Tax=Ceratopteris richardii TaxID=49495 RepID=A0A8T2S6W1_CERRI|nr:hypothetical protein KP509_22G063000 [Ceratopteris richardii]